MKGDFSRNSFDPSKQYSSVRMQQGRVQIDADWNEQMDITDYYNRLFTEDFLGQAIGPSSGAGFKISGSDADFNIGMGRYYVNGLLLENLNDTTYTAQPYYPTTIDTLSPFDNTPNSVNNIYVAYLEIWQQSVSMTDDVDIAETALNGADTATRLRNIPQVKLLHAVWDGSLTLKYTVLFDPSSSNSAVQQNVQRWQALNKRLISSSNTNISQLTPQVSDSLSLQNQLYRTEIHQASATATVQSIDIPTNKITLQLVAAAGQSSWNTGDALQMSTDARQLVGMAADVVTIDTVSNTNNTVVITATISGALGSDIVMNSTVNIPNVKPNTTTIYHSTATFKWSRDNASVNTTCAIVANGSDGAKYDITVHAIPQDGISGFNLYQWLELSLPDWELQGKAGNMVQITGVSGNTLTVSGAVDATIITAKNAIARRWDTETTSITSQAVNPVTSITTNPAVNLEKGLSITFSGSDFKVGDYWLIPSRMANNSKNKRITWPLDSANNFIAQPPQGIQRVYAPLAILQRTATGWDVTDDSRSIATSQAKLDVVGADVGAPSDSIHVDSPLGQVGIGTDTPSAKLEVITNGRAGQDAIHATATSTNGIAIQASTDNNKAAQFTNNSTQPTLKLTNNGDGNGIEAAVTTGYAGYLTNNSTTHLTLYVENTGDETAAIFFNNTTAHPTLAAENKGNHIAAAFANTSATYPTLSVVNNGGGQALQANGGIAADSFRIKGATTDIITSSNDINARAIQASIGDNKAAQFTNTSAQPTLQLTNNGTGTNSGSAAQLTNNSSSNPTLSVTNNGSGYALNVNGATVTKAKPRYAFGTSVVGTKIYAIAGSGDNSMEVYDTTNPSAGWKLSSATLTTLRSGLSTSVVGTKIYAIGGSNVSGGNSIFLNSVEVYDTLNPNQGWRLLPSSAWLTQPRAYFGSSVLNGDIYAIGGYNSSNNVLSSVEIFT